MNVMSTIKGVTMIVEASKDGFGVYSESDFPCTGFGNTVEEAKQDMLSAFDEALRFARDTNDEDTLRKLNDGKVKFVYTYDLQSIFNYFRVLNVSAFAESIGMNDSMLRRLKSADKVTEKQKKKIESGLHAIGKQLLEVQL